MPVKIYNKIYFNFISFQLPSNATEWLKISKVFEEKWNFPHVIGSIDGKHVTLKQPANTGSQFFNYKQNFSIVLLGIVDANCNFIFADVGCQGRISDGGVLANSAIYERLERRELNIPAPEILQIPYNIEVPYFFLGDQAFAFKEYCLRPFSGMHAANSIERLFNYRHSRARRTVENGFGIDAKVWRVLAKPMELEPDVAEKVVLATIHLHNFKRRHLLWNYNSTLLARSRNMASTSEESNVESTTSMLPLRHVALRPTRVLQIMRLHLARHLKLNDPLPFSLPQPRRIT